MYLVNFVKMTFWLYRLQSEKFAAIVQSAWNPLSSCDFNNPAIIFKWQMGLLSFSKVKRIIILSACVRDDC